MTATVYSVNEAGELVDSDGNVLGRIVEVTIDADFPRAPFRGQTSTATSTATARSRSKSKSKPMSNSTSIVELSTQAVWDHYVNTFGATRQQLNAQRKRVIQQALKTNTVEECCRAITGLSKSPFHNGQNDRQSKYLDVRYALKGNGARGESADERIASMAELASLPSPTAATKVTAVEAGYVAGLRDTVRRAWHSDPSKPGPGADDVIAAAAAIAELSEDYGIVVSYADNGRPVFS